MVPIEREYRPIFFVLLANFALFGASMTLVGATLPTIIDTFKWSYTATGFVLASGSVGYFVATLLSGAAVGGLGLRRSLLTGAAMQAAGLALFALWPPAWVNGVLLFAIGLGHGTTEVVTNVCVVRMERHGQSRVMNLMHSAFCVGAMLAPLAVSAWVVRWAMLYRYGAGLTVVIGLGFLALPFSRMSGEDEQDGGRRRAAELLRRPLFILGAVMLFIYVGAELGVSDWSAEYFVTALGQTPAAAAGVVSVFWIGLLAGRLAVGYFYHGTRQDKVLLVLALTCTAGLTFALSVSSPGLSKVGFFIAGLGYSAVYPLVMALVGQYFKRWRGVALGIASAGGAAGAIAFKFLMGAVSDAVGVSSGFRLYVALNVAMVAVAGAMIWRVCRLRRGSNGE